MSERLEEPKPDQANHAGDRIPREIQRRLGQDEVPRFELEMPDGTRSIVGVGGEVGSPAFRISLHNDRAADALLSLDEYAFAEVFLNGDLDVEGDILQAFQLRRRFSDFHPFYRILRHARPLVVGQTRQNRQLIPRHYDRGNEFYFSFLDRRHRLYSQALFFDDTDGLERAAENKLEYILSACRIGAGTRVLDVGAGWGSFSRFAMAAGADVTMLTVSEEQQKYLQKAVGRENRDRVVLEDVFAYSTSEPFDAIVLLGVMEHLPQYDRVLRHFDGLLKPDGRIYMDFSAVSRKYRVSTVTYRYVFEGNGSPVFLPGLIKAANRGPYEVVEIHNDRHSYFLTLKCWAESLERHRKTLVSEFGERTFRLFRLYLWSTTFDLHNGGLESYRVVLQKCRGRPSHTLV
jgi:cyclopropane-fatty-acyl-phospholipid synthase